MRKSMRRFVAELKEEARRLGFQGTGVCAPTESGHSAYLARWVEAGFHGSMGYLARPDALSRRGDLRRTMESVRSVVVLTQDYFQPDPPGIPGDPALGVIARYARGQDYHDVIRGRLQELLDWISRTARKRELAPEVRGLLYVDTGPILERELGQRAGLGWFGKNTMLIHPGRGSYFFLAVLLLDLELPVDPSFDADRCGSCRTCLDACPTGALLGRDASGAPVMDARRCISYLTIEHQGPIPRELRPLMGNRIFGCDICQEVCPWNRKFAEVSEEPAYLPSPGDPFAGVPGAPTDGPELTRLMTLTQEEFSTLFSGSPVKRARRRGFLRNVAVALGNWLGSLEDPPEGALGALVAALSDPEPLIRGHAVWALGRILERGRGNAVRLFFAVKALGERQAKEDDPWVLEELRAVLDGEGG